MGRYGRKPDEIRMDIAVAVGEGRCPIEYLRERHEREWSL